MRRIKILGGALLFMVSLVASSAFAQSPHFIRASASLTSAGSLVVSFKEAGLGSNQLIDITASATGTAVYACFTKSGNHPQASNKVGPTLVTASGTFSSGKNGQITASLTIAPPASTLTCPKGQILRLASVRYENVTVTDTTNNVSISVAGSYSKVFYNLGPGKNA